MSSVIEKTSPSMESTLSELLLRMKSAKANAQTNKQTNGAVEHAKANSETNKQTNKNSVMKRKRKRGDDESEITEVTPIKQLKANVDNDALDEI